MKVIVWEGVVIIIGPGAVINVSDKAILFFNGMDVHTIDIGANEEIQKHFDSLEGLREIFPKILARTFSRFIMNQEFHDLDLHQSILNIRKASPQDVEAADA